MVFSLRAFSVESAQFRLVTNREIMRSNLTGVTQVSVRPGARWSASVETRRMSRAQGEELNAQLMRGLEESFYLSPPNTATPINGNAFGSPLVLGAGQTGKTLVTDGWMSGYTLKAGDWFSFSNGTFEELHKVGQDATATGGGAMSIPLVRGIIRSPANNAALRRLPRPPSCAVGGTSAFGALRHVFVRLQVAIGLDVGGCSLRRVQ